MWTDLRKDIEQTRKELRIPDSEFAPVSIHLWKDIQNQIFSTFCKDRNSPLSEQFLKNSHSKQVIDGWPDEHLLKLIPADEKVWFFITELKNERNKFWFYEGFIGPVNNVMASSYYNDEIFLASKKYKWLIMVNHHDYIIATGEEMPEKLSNLDF